MIQIENKADEELFERLENFAVHFQFFECDEYVSLEVLYQTFKERMLREAAEEEVG